MKVNLTVCFLIMIILISCGRTDIGKIRNNTNDTLELSLKLNYPASRQCPDNYFREELFQRKLRLESNKDSTVYWLTQLDTASNIAKIVLLPNKSINLGTVRMGTHRNDYKSWEFTELTVIGKNLNIQVKDSGLSSFIKRNSHFIGQDDYEFNIGESE